MNPALAFYGRPKGPPRKARSIKALTTELAKIEQWFAVYNRETAYHEAGHIVVGLAVGFKAKSVTMAGPEGLATSIAPEQGFTEQKFIAAAAGAIAQRRVANGRDLSEIAASDNTAMKGYLLEIAAGMETEAEVERQVRLLYALAEHYVTENWPAIVRVAEALVEKKTLTAAEIMEAAA